VKINGEFEAAISRANLTNKATINDFYDTLFIGQVQTNLENQEKSE